MMPSSTHPVTLVYHNKSRGEAKANVTVLVLTSRLSLSAGEFINDLTVPHIQTAT